MLFPPTAAAHCAEEAPRGDLAWHELLGSRSGASQAKNRPVLYGISPVRRSKQQQWVANAELGCPKKKKAYSSILQSVYSVVVNACLALYRTSPHVHQPLEWVKIWIPQGRAVSRQWPVKLWSPGCILVLFAYTHDSTTLWLQPTSGGQKKNDFLLVLAVGPKSVVETHYVSTHGCRFKSLIASCSWGLGDAPWPMGILCLNA